MTSMKPVATYPLTRMTSGTIGPVGVELVIASAGADADTPEGGTSCYTVALHADGSHCSRDCGCVDPEVHTRIWEDREVVRGEWTWHASRYVLVGWRKTGPTEDEAEVQKRVAELIERAEELADDLDHERGLHQVTKADLGHNIRAVKRLQDDREDAHRALRLARAAHLRAEDDAATWKRRAIVAAAVATAATVIGAAVILLLVWAVIA